MSVQPHAPRNLGDLRTRFAALWLESAHTPYPDSIRADVLELITASKPLLDVDAIGEGYMMQAVNFLNHGNFRFSAAHMPGQARALVVHVSQPKLSG
jgi:hypothetical protein